MPGSRRIGYFDCFSGASGDMILGALVDAGLGLDVLRQGLERLPLPAEYSLSAAVVQRGAISCTQVHVETAESHAHRHLSDISQMIQASDLSAAVKERSIAIFRRLAEAEAHVHGTTVEAIHFHEVGGVDAIVDIVGSVYGMEQLGIERLFASALPLGTGTVQSAHGTLPLPAPATLELLALAHAPTIPWPATKELVTPTGAAILGTLAEFRQPPIRLERVGYGAGGRDLPWPNVLRLWIGTASDDELLATTSLRVLEANIDDMNPEVYGHVMGKLFQAGARDVYMTPVYMKKNRPGTILSVIGRAEDASALAELMLRETSTLGVRSAAFERYEADREMRRVDTPHGAVDVKLKLLRGKVISVAPEYESCRRLADESGVPLPEIYRLAEAAGKEYVEHTDG